MEVNDEYKHPRRRHVKEAPVYPKDTYQLQLPKNHPCHACPMYDRNNPDKLFCPMPRCFRDTIDQIAKRR